MIIDQESHLRKTQLDTGQAPIATASTPLIPNESPPAYTPREDLAASSSSAPPYHNPSSLPETQKRPPDRAAKRFFKTLILALCLYAAIALTCKFLFFFPMSGPPHGPPVGHPEPEDGRIVRCIMGRDIPWDPSAPVQFPLFSIPSNSSTITVLARGNQGTGRVKVESVQTDINDGIAIDVVARYHSWDFVMGTAVCLMEKEKGELSVGIFTPNHLTWTNRRTNFEVTVKIPYQLSSPVLEIPRLEILAPTFHVTLPSADEFVHFHDLIIHTTNAPVAVDAVKATNIDIQTSNAAIQGTFSTDSSLSLKTSNAQIRANIFLENNASSGKATSVVAATTNGLLTGVISLSNAETPRYNVRADTTNAGLNLSFLQTRSDPSYPSSLPILDIVGSTSNAQAELLMESPFEGSFNLSTSNAPVDFSSGSGSKDPLGLGRQQHVEFTNNLRSRKQGRVYWGDLDDGRELGRVKLSTSNGRASLHLQ